MFINVIKIALINILYAISKLWLNNILLIRNNSDESHNVPSIFFMSQNIVSVL